MKLLRFLVVAVFASNWVVSSEAQRSPLMDMGVAKAGPNQDEADYRYVSVAMPEREGWRFEYNVCNLRERNMAFYWEDVGYGMDPADPLPAGLCATYDRSGAGEKFEHETKLIFNNGNQLPAAYLPCDGESGCSVKATGFRFLTATLKAFFTKHVEDKLQPNRRTSVVAPLRVVVTASGRSGSAKEVQVDWTGGVKFIAFFPDAKLGKEQLAKVINQKIGKLTFDTFPAFANQPQLLLAGSAPAVITLNPGDRAESGNFIFQMSEQFPPTRKVILLAVDQSGRPVARIDAPLP